MRFNLVTFLFIAFFSLPSFASQLSQFVSSMQAGEFKEISAPANMTEELSSHTAGGQNINQFADQCFYLPPKPGSFNEGAVIFLGGSFITNNDRDITIFDIANHKFVAPFSFSQRFSALVGGRHQFDHVAIDSSNRYLYFTPNASSGSDVNRNIHRWRIDDGYTDSAVDENYLVVPKSMVSNASEIHNVKWAPFLGSEGMLLYGTNATVNPVGGYRTLFAWDPTKGTGEASWSKIGDFKLDATRSASVLQSIMRVSEKGEYVVWGGGDSAYSNETTMWRIDSDLSVTKLAKNNRPGWLGDRPLGFQPSDGRIVPATMADDPNSDDMIVFLSEKDGANREVRSWNAKTDSWSTPITTSSGFLSGTNPYLYTVGCGINHLGVVAFFRWKSTGSSVYIYKHKQGLPQLPSDATPDEPTNLEAN